MAVTYDVGEICGWGLSVLCLKKETEFKKACYRKRDLSEDPVLCMIVLSITKSDAATNLVSGNADQAGLDLVTQFRHLLCKEYEV